MIFLLYSRARALNIALKLKKHTPLMTNLIAAFVVAAIQAVFFHRTMDLDIVASIMAGVFGTATLGLLIAGAVYAGQIF